MKVAFRVDASNRIGSGHVMRCLTLAEVVRARGAVVHFVCRDHPGNHATTIRNRGFDVTLMPMSTSAERQSPDAGNYASWIGDAWSADADETARRVAQVFGGADWVVVDHYALGAEWERRVRAVTSRILAIDDLANREHDCDLLLDQNLVEGYATRYDALVPNRCRTMLGPSYALLQPTYARLRNSTKPRAGAVKRIFVAFGGADATNLTGKVVSAFRSLGVRGVTMDVIVDPNSSSSADIRRTLGSRDDVRLSSGLPTLAPLMAESDASIGATGATTWERCCLGLPSIVITLAENQRPIARKLHEMGVVRWLGDATEVGEAEIAGALRTLLERPLDPEWSLRSFSLVDGQGADRVRVAMTMPVLEASGMRLRRAEARDSTMLRDWRNDPAVVAASRQSSPVSEADHAGWFDAALRSPNRDIYIVEVDGAPVGTVRVDRGQEGQELSWTVSPAARGQGIGKTMVKLVADALDDHVYAEVKPGNDASAGIARYAGLTDERPNQGMRRFQRPGKNS